MTNLIDMLRADAARTQRVVYGWMNGIPVAVRPDGLVQRRESIPAFVLGTDGVYRRKSEEK